MTPQAIRDGFQDLRDGAEMDGLADAARSRSESDWLIGINGTRAMTKRMFGSRGATWPPSAACKRRRWRSFTRANWRSGISSRAIFGESPRHSRSRRAIRRRLSAARLQKEWRRTRRIDRIWEKDDGGSHCRRMPGQTGASSPRKRKPARNRAAAVRPDHVAARSQRAFRFPPRIRSGSRRRFTKSIKC